MSATRNSPGRAFARRIYSFSGFLGAIARVGAHLRDLWAGNSRSAGDARSAVIDRAFGERIMAAVTGVNACRYCTYVHTRLGLAAGLSAGELKGLFGGEFGAAPDREVPALLFAQHYAESRDAYSEQAWQRVVDFYGLLAAKAILARIRMMTIGNLWGNTLDAFLSRLAGRPAPGSNPFSELGVILLPVLLAPLALVAAPIVWLGRVLGRPAPAA